MKELVREIEFTMLQLILVMQIMNTCMYKKNDKNKKKLFITMIAFLIITTIIPYYIYRGIIGILIIHSISLLSVFLIHEGKRIEAIVSFSISYLFIGTCAMVYNEQIYFKIGTLVSDVASAEKYCDFFVHILLITVIVLCIKFKNQIKTLFTMICSSNEVSSLLVVSTYITDIFIIVEFTENFAMTPLIKKILIMILCIILIIVTNYFTKVQRKSDSINELNKALEDKNNQLRKIKHDYGAQISYLYGLYLLNRWEDLGKSLKDLCCKNRSVLSAVSIKNHENSIVYKALKPALKSGVHVILEEHTCINSANLNEQELFMIICNIRRNAIKAMDGKGIIIARIYEMMGSVIIKIESSGHKFERKHLQNIFCEEYTESYKNNKEIRELTILYQLVEKNNGKIHIKSTTASTEFKLTFPILISV